MSSPSVDDALNLVPCALLSFAEDGSLLSLNDASLKVLGYSRDELLGRPMETLLTLASRMFFQTHFFPLLRMHGKVEEISLSLRSKTGDAVPVLVNAARQERAEGAVHHCALMTVRERGKYEEELLKARRVAEESLQSNEELRQARQELETHARELDQKLSQLEQRNQQLTRVSHILSQDLREPVRKISMFACLFTREDREGLSLTGQRSLDRIKSVSVRLEQLVTALHQLVMLDVADEPLEEVDLLDALGSARQRLAETAGPHSMTLRCGPLPVIEGRRRQLVMLFYHLLDNAAKFRRPDTYPQVDIECQRIQQNGFRSIKDRYRYIDFVRIVFADNGMGFDSGNREFVFEVLTKLDQESPGLGIGLPFCRKVMDNHKGSISVESEPGRGTRFTLLLPLRQ